MCELRERVVNSSGDLSEDHVGYAHGRPAPASVDDEQRVAVNEAGAHQDDSSKHIGMFDENAARLATPSVPHTLLQTTPLLAENVGTEPQLTASDRAPSLEALEVEETRKPNADAEFDILVSTSLIDRLSGKNSAPMRKASLGLDSMLSALEVSSVRSGTMNHEMKAGRDGFPGFVTAPVSPQLSTISGKGFTSPQQRRRRARKDPFHERLLMEV